MKGATSRFGKIRLEPFQIDRDQVQPPRRWPGDERQQGEPAEAHPDCSHVISFRRTHADAGEVVSLVEIRPPVHHEGCHRKIFLHALLLPSQHERASQPKHQHDHRKS